MDGVLPLSMSLTTPSVQAIGAQFRRGLVEVVRPPLTSIERDVKVIAAELTLMTLAITDSIGNIEHARLRVQVMNEDLLDHVEAGRWAVAYMSYVQMVELLDLLRRMAWLDGRSHIHLHDIIAGLARLHDDMIDLSMEVQYIGTAVVGLLQQILDALGNGIAVHGQVQIVITGGGGGDWLSGLDLWKLLKLLGLLALGLGIIVLFLFGVGAALSIFTPKALLAVAAIAGLVFALMPLIKLLASLEWDDLWQIGVGFAFIAAFVALLGLAFRTFTSELDKIIPQLKTFFEAIGALMSTIAGFKWDQIWIIGAAFLGIAAFVALLGLAFRTFTSDLEAIIPHLNTFFESMAKLMTTLSGFKPAQMWFIAGGLLAIAVFVALLGLAFRTFKSDLASIIPHLNEFFTSIGKLMTTLSAFKPAQMWVIAGGFLAIAVFVALLGLAFRTFTSDLEAIVPHLNTFFEAIGNLMVKLAEFTGWDLAGIAVGFLLIAGFVWLLGMALGTFSETAIAAIDPLTNLFTALTDLMTKLAEFTVLDFVGIAAGFLLIAGFVWALSMAMNTMTAQTVAALPNLTALIQALASLAQLMANMSAGDMIGMTIGLAILAAFIWAVAAALVYAAGPLNALGAIMEGIGTIIETITGLFGGLVDLIGSIGSAISDFFGGIGDFFGGESLDMEAIMAEAQIAVPSAAPPPPPPAAVAAVPSAPSLGALAPGGALAAAPAAGPTTVDQTVNAGGITVNVNAERLEADSAQLLTDDIVAQLQARLGSLRSEQDFRGGARPAAA